MRILLTVGLLIAIHAPIEATAGNSCNGTSIDYQLVECTITRKTLIGDKHCIDMPGLKSTKCKMNHFSNQGNVQTVKRMTGQATVTKCTEEGACNGDSDTCDITYMVAHMFKPVVADEETESSYGNSDDPESPLISFAVVWNGSAIRYRVTNLANEAHLITWAGTPIQTRVVGPAEVVDEFVSAICHPTPITTLASMTDSMSGAFAEIPVTTFIPATSVPADGLVQRITAFVLLLAVGVATATRLKRRSVRSAT